MEITFFKTLDTLIGHNTSKKKGKNFTNEKFAAIHKFLVYR